MRAHQFGRDLPGERVVRKVRSKSGQVSLHVTLAVEWPREFSYLREAFEFLSTQRESGQHGLPQPMQFTDIEAGLRQIGEALAPWEVRALTAMDTAYCNALSAVMADDMKRHAKKEG